MRKIARTTNPVNPTVPVPTLVPRPKNLGSPPTPQKFDGFPEYTAEAIVHATRNGRLKMPPPLPTANDEAIDAYRLAYCDMMSTVAATYSAPLLSRSHMRKALAIALGREAGVIDLAYERERRRLLAEGRA